MIPLTTRKEERGAAALLLVVSGIVAGLMVLILWALPIAGASTQQSKTQSAADAAALAGADAVVGSIADNLKGLGGWNGSYAGLSSISGADRAGSYAGENGATLIAYNGPSASDDWKVDARVRRVIDGTSYESDATAQLELPSCSVKADDPEPTPTPTPTPTPDDDEGDDEGDEEEPPPPPPPPPPNSKITCDGLPTFTIIEGDLSLTPGWPAFVDALLGGSHVKLIR